MDGKWIEWMWRVDGKWMWIEWTWMWKVESGKWIWMWMWKVESGAVPDLTDATAEALRANID